MFKTVHPMWKAGIALMVSAMIWSGWTSNDELTIDAPEVVVVTGKVGNQVGDEAPEIAMNNPKGKKLSLIHI